MTVLEKAMDNLQRATKCLAYNDVLVWIQQHKNFTETELVSAIEEMKRKQNW